LRVHSGRCRCHFSLPTARLCEPSCDDISICIGCQLCSDLRNHSRMGSISTARFDSATRSHRVDACSPSGLAYGMGLIEHALRAAPAQIERWARCRARAPTQEPVRLRANETGSLQPAMLVGGVSHLTQARTVVDCCGCVLIRDMGLIERAPRAAPAQIERWARCRARAPTQEPVRLRANGQLSREPARLRAVAFSQKGDRPKNRRLRPVSVKLRPLTYTIESSFGP
jgi:hypothetical protein